MTDSIDKKSKEKHDKLDVDLDAMLDKAESSLVPIHEFDDEDAIDRLLMNAGFDADDASLQAEVNKNAHVVKDVDLHDELDGFLSFEGLGATLNELEKAQASETEKLEQTVGNSSLTPLNEAQDDEDALDRLLMSADLEADDALPGQASTEDVDALGELEDFSDFSDFSEPEPEIVPPDEADEAEQAKGNLTDEFDGFFGLSDDFDESDLIQDDELETSLPAAADLIEVAGVEEAGEEEDAGALEERDDFSDFSDFNEPGIVPPVEIEEPEQVTENSSVADDAGLDDEVDDFFGLSDDFDESDLIQDDELETSLPAAADLIEVAGVEEAGEEEDAGALEERDDFSDFSDFNEPGIVPPVEIEEPEQVTENSSVADDAGLDDEVDDFTGLSDDFDESDLIQDDELETSLPAAADLIEVAGVEEAGEEEDAGALEERDDFSDFSDFNEPGIVPPVEIEEPEQVTENSSVADDAGLDDEVDDFTGLSDGFDESDLIQDDELETSLPVAADLIEVAGEEKDTDALEERDDFSDFSDFNEPGIVPSVEVEEPEQVTENSSVADDAGLEGEVDDFTSLSDGFDESDLIQDDEAGASADLVADNEGRQAIVEESFNDLQDDENSFDSQFTDAGFDAEEALEQAVEKKDEFGDDADLSKIDSFFQLDEVSDDFAKQIEDAQLEETEKSSVQEDDFLLPDFDITADSEISVSGDKDDEFADVFGDTDFLNEDPAMQASVAEIAELKSGENEAVVEPASKQVADTTVEDVKDVKLNPFGFEQEDMKKQLEEAENKVKKAKLFSYAALGFGAVALSAAVGLGVMMYGAKTEVSKLTETVSTLKASLAKNAENNPNEEINAVMNSVVQLNHQVYGFITELKENPQIPVDLLNNNVSDIVAKQGMVSKALDILQVKMGGLEEKAPAQSSAAEPLKAEAAHEPVPVKEGNTHEIAPVKSETGHDHAQAKEGVAHESAPPKEVAAHEPAPAKVVATHESVPTKEVTAHEHEPAKEKTMHETVPAKVEAVPEAAPAKVKTQSEPVTAKPITPEKAELKEEPVNVKKQADFGKWGINLVAVKQEWYAKSKAAEFARQGVFAEVIPVQGNNAMMYRLRVGGFKSKAEANSNTDRIKKALNLDNVWVSDN